MAKQSRFSREEERLFRTVRNGVIPIERLSEQQKERWKLWLAETG